MKIILLPLLGLVLAAGIGLTLVRVLESEDEDPRVTVPIVTPRTEVPVARRDLATLPMVETPAPEEAPVVMSEEAPAAEPTEDPVAAPRRDPKVIAEMKPWWTERAQTLQATIAAAAREGATSEDIQRLMSEFQAEVERRYEDTARSMAR